MIEPDEAKNDDNLTLGPGDMLEGPSDRYEVIEKLGSGGEADVYQVRSGRFAMLFAAKVIKFVSNDIDETIPEFLAMTELRHRNVISCYGGFVCQGHVILLYEHCEGGTLEDLLRSHPDGLPPDQFLSFARQLVEGVRYCHDRDIAHCDLKPANVLFRDANDSVLRISDFGASTRKSQAEAMQGTLQYMAPERFLEAKVEPKATDVWSLGMMLIKMKTGMMPLEGRDDSDLPWIIPAEDFSWQVQDERLSELLKWMLSMEPAKRPTLAEVAAHPALVSEPLPVPVPVRRAGALGRRTSAGRLTKMTGTWVIPKRASWDDELGPQGMALMTRRNSNPKRAAIAPAGGILPRLEEPEW
jgi:serine/threonine protein kinase